MTSVKPSEVRKEKARPAHTPRRASHFMGERMNTAVSLSFGRMYTNVSKGSGACLSSSIVFFATESLNAAVCAAAEV